MEIILLGKIENLGVLGDTVNVKSGYARNYLIPKGKAVLATPGNVATFEARRAELEKQQTDVLGRAQARAEKINGFVMVISAKAGDEGRLFGSVGAREIVAAASAAGVEIKKEEIRLSEGPLRRTGEYEITAHLHPDVESVMTVNVVPE
uniref:Large ribosomal subunit protein bL9 n=1 Tax=Candidatus Kentrum sp. SD TaxID=2126332 RepID=A0A451BIN3_9GAMM|nr:MAG: LSU ribosomal protein L9P [Candidatus Kentron sp. SD]VFK42515.1 MAG: LSU ribosomal protein L9P [Candidatus Kentron sp. SD]VFK78163.1 MAG: LSU ribosomal protein L9P [Candidatus Kentron sp. SD]